MKRIYTCLVITILSGFAWAKEDIKDLNAHLKTVPGYAKKSHVEKLAYLASLQKNRRLDPRKAYQACHEKAYDIMKSIVDAKKTGTDKLDALLALEKEFTQDGRLQALSVRPSNFQNGPTARYLYEDKGYADLKPLERLKLIKATAEKYKLGWMSIDSYKKAIWIEVLYSPKWTTPKVMEFFAEAVKAQVWQTLPRGSMYEERVRYHLAKSLKDDATYQKADLDGKVKHLKGMLDAGKVGEATLLEEEVDALIEAAGKSAKVPALGKMEVFGKCKAQKVISWGNYVSRKETELLAELMATDPAFTKGNLAAKIKYIGALEDKRIITSFVQSDKEAEVLVAAMKADPGFAKMSKDQKIALLEKLSKGFELGHWTKGKVKENLGLK